ncbi:bifunctional phosphoribosylaminoimidazolecarboxamide formyltransferase/IMP cyclohydrolase [Polaribacter irgensii 23-P]|uniref:Bifunctional phosphoribosylaminoimidazolecarboxamide formyltransferase/IMP cyclohydrolase n=1 Tax=Polaribacter irgensii 23-P TaxID=313594 RepID=A4BYB9_9FLAO|nr:bifunctional phosphoribosylaminoimidazolecarboxamide formyltransferase/IMP cyclohydrolase [Polaribacter irgensii 23-P]
MKGRHSESISKGESTFSFAAERQKKPKNFKEKFIEWFRDFLENSE